VNILNHARILQASCGFPLRGAEEDGRYIPGMPLPPVTVAHNYLDFPRGRHSLLLANCGRLEVEVVRLGEAFTVYGIRRRGSGCWTEKAIAAETIDQARQTTRALIRRLGA
jgi:hypothetical protein